MERQPKAQASPLLVVQADVPGVDESTGDYQYRTYGPGAAMAALPEVYVVNLSHEHRRREAIYEAADVLILNGLCDLDLFPVIHRRRCAGKPTIFEFGDDLFNIPSCNPRHQFFARAENRWVIEQLAQSCDALQFSTPNLFKKYGHWAKTAMVFENHLHYLPPAKKPRRQPEVVVGWAGSFGHYNDLDRIVPALVRWITSRSDIRFHFMGADRLWELFTSLPDQCKTKFPPGSLSDYSRFLETLDIGIAPMEDTLYNQSRSDVKFLEYAAHGVVPVLQDVEPYRSSVRPGETGLFFEDGDGLVAILEGLAKDFYRRVGISVAARDYVLCERMLGDHALERIRFYRCLTGKNPPRSAQAPSPAQLFRGFDTLEGALLRGRHVVLMPTTFELILRDLLIANSSVPRAHLYSLLQLAAGAEVDNYLPHLYGAYAAPDPAASLELALAQNPNSINAWRLLASELHRRGNRSRAAECLAESQHLLSACGVIVPQS